MGEKKNNCRKIELHESVTKDMRRLLSQNNPRKSDLGAFIICLLIHFFVLVDKNPAIYNIKKMNLSIKLCKLGKKLFDNNTETISLRIPDVLRSAIKKLMPLESLENIIEYMLRTVLANLEGDILPCPDIPLLRVMGNKYQLRMQKAIENILKNIKYTNVYDLCCGGLGISSLSYKIGHATKIYISDIEKDKSNLYKVIKNSPTYLVNELLSYAINIETFNRLKNDTTKTSPVERAAKYLYINYTHAIFLGEDYYDSRFDDMDDFSIYCEYFKTVAMIYHYHEMFQNFDIANKDILYILNNTEFHKEDLITVDPPYLDTEVYKNNLTGKNPKQSKKVRLAIQERNLRKIAEHLIELSKAGVYFMYFCRIKNKPLKKDASERKIAEWEKKNKRLEDFHDKHYKDKGLYYIDVKLNNGAIDRIITNIKFDGAIQY